MRERAEQLGGRLEIVATDIGTTLVVTLPLGESNEEDTHTGGGRP
jgi:signal transduction histidine kinase